MSSLFVSVHAIKRRDVLILLLVLFIAALMRFGQAGVVPFFHDEAMLSTMAQEMAAGERFYLTGINSSVGIPNPPQSVYMMVLPFAFSSDPQVATFFVMLLNVVGVGLLWLMAHRYFGRTAALIAGLTYALNPWAILYSRKIWAQEFHTPLILLAVLLGLYGFWEAQRRTDNPSRPRLLNRHEWAQALCLPVLLWSVQIHFAAWLLMSVYLVLLWYGRARVSWRALVVSALLSALVMLPYALGLGQTLQSDPTRITDAISRSDASDGLTLSAQPLLYMLYLMTGFGMETWIAPAQQAELLTAVPPVALWALIPLMILHGVGVGFFQQPKLTVLLLVWLVLPFMAFVPQWTPVYAHYFIPTLPVMALLAGIGTAWIASIVPLQPSGRSIIVVAYCVILLTQGLWWRGMLRYVDDNHIVYPGFTTPLHYLHDIRDALRPYDDVVVISYGMSWNLHHESAVWPVLLRDEARCVRTLVGNGYAVFPSQPFAVLVAPDAPENPVLNLYATQTGRIYEERPGGGDYRLYVHEQAPDWTLTPITPLEPALFDNGVRLTGYYVGDGWLVLQWRLPDGERGQDYQYSGQIFDADGERLAQVDRVFWHGRHWCADDRLITWVPLDMPAGAQSLHVSLYELGTGRDAGRFFNADVLDALGNAIGQQVVIPLNSAMDEVESSQNAD